MSGRIDCRIILIYVSFFLGLLLQATFLKLSTVEHDIILGQDIASRLIDGGTYSKDFFENNPPLLFYFHSVAQLIARSFGTNPIFTWYGLTFFFTVLSFSWSHRLLDKSFSDKQDLKINYLFFLMIALLIVPLINFSQKSHWLILLTLPYFFLQLLRIEGKTIAWHEGAAIGAVSALGFSLKPPYYFFSPLLIEIFLLASSKSIRGLFRVEIITLTFVVVLYFFSIFLIHGDYVKTVFPIALFSYAPLATTTLFELLVSRSSLLFFLLIVFFMGMKKNDNFFKQARFFLIAAFGFLLSYFLQKKGWPYQEIPALVMSVIAITPLYQFYLNVIENKNQPLFVAKLFTFLAVFSLIYQPVLSKLKSGLECTIHQHCSLHDLVDKVSPLAVNGEFFVFSEAVVSSYISYYGSLHLGSRFASLWMNPYSLKDGKRVENNFVPNIKRFINEDFQTYQPTLVLVSRRQKKDYLNVGESYFKLMIKDSNFSGLWQNYSYIKTVKNNPFEFDVYVKKYTPDPW